MILLKPFLILAGSVAGTVGLTSISSLKDWDPSNVWRVSAKDKFYLFTCKDKGPEVKVYLKFKNSDRTLENNKELELEGVGYSLSRGRGNKIENLHEEVEGVSGESTFVLQLTKSGDAWLQELGEASSHIFSDDSLSCGKSLIKIENRNHENYIDIGLKNVSFQLKDCQQNRDNKRQECSIDIIYKTRTQDKKLEWVDNFKPIVIN